MGRTRYEALGHFLGGWFHQDFDIEGETWEEVVDAYLRSATTHDAAAVARDVDAFLADAGPGADEAFARVFRPDVEPAGFGLTPSGWLVALAARLRAAAGAR